MTRDERRALIRAESEARQAAEAGVKPELVGLNWWQRLIFALASLRFVRRMRWAMRARARAVVIRSGRHRYRADGMCATEVVSWLAGEPQSDGPACVCPVLAHAVRVLNDRIVDGSGDPDSPASIAMRRKYLADVLPRLVGTASSDMTLLTRRAEAASAPGMADLLAWRARLVAVVPASMAGRLGMVTVEDVAGVAGKAIADATPKAADTFLDPVAFKEGERRHLPRQSDPEGYARAVAIIERMLEVR